MAIRLTRNQIQPLKELAAAGKHGRTIVAPASSAELAHLISVQYIMRQALNLDTKQYVITRLGRQALAEATAE